MTRKVSDNELGRFARIQTDLFRRVAQGTIPPEEAIEGLKAIITRKFVLTDYAERFAAAIKGCTCDYQSPALTPKVFGEDVFGELGEGYVLGEMPKSKEVLARGYWTDADLDAYVTSAEVVGAGLEAATLADLCEYGKRNPEKQREVAILCWRPTKNGRVACLFGSGSERGFGVGRLEGDWNSSCRVLLRKVKKPVEPTYAERFAAAIKGCACNYASPDLTSEVFGEDVFGTLAEEGVTLAQPPTSDAARRRGYWLDSEIDEWLAGAEVAGKGLESCYLVDLAKYGEDHPDEQRTKAIVCWRPTKNGRVAYLGRYGSLRGFCVGRREDDWGFRCWFLLRKVRQ